MYKNLLIIIRDQFGYHTDYYKYCEYLRNDFTITFFCFDSRFKKLEMNGVKVKYVSTKGNRTVRGVRFLLKAFFEIVNFNGIVFIKYFEHCKLLKFVFPQKKLVVDIRSLSVSPKVEERIRYDKELKKAISHFDFITIISKGLREKLKLEMEKSAILPLGADVLSTSNKDFSQEIKLLYVGSLDGRNIDQTIIGMALFFKNNPKVNNVTYDIIGDGKGLTELKGLVIREKLRDKIKFHGRIPHFELKPFFESCTVGISYVPKTEYYEHQPVTKTYEYILSGMPCIATSTYENKKVINKINGVLCDDNPQSFAHALEKIYQNHKRYSSNEIRETLRGFTWEEIVKNRLIPLLNRIY